MDGQGRRILILFCVFVLTGCGLTKKSKEGPARWDSLPVTIYADPAINNSSTAKADLSAAMNFWNSRAGRQLFDFRGDWKGTLPPYSGNPASPDTLFGNVIYFERNWPFAANVAGQTVIFSSEKSLLSSVIMIHSDMNLCSGECVATFGTSQRKVFAHELGHFLGLQHHNSAANVMYPEIQPGASLDSLEIDASTFRQLTTN